MLHLCEIGTEAPERLRVVVVYRSLAEACLMSDLWIWWVGLSSIGCAPSSLNPGVSFKPIIYNLHLLDSATRLDSALEAENEVS